MLTTVNVAAAPTCPGLKSSQAVIMVILVSIVYSGLVFPPGPSAQQVPVSGYTGAGDTVHTGPALLCPNWKLETTLTQTHLNAQPVLGPCIGNFPINVQRCDVGGSDSQ